MKDAANEFAKYAPRDFVQRLSTMQSELDKHPDVVTLKTKYPERETKLSELYHYIKSCDRCRQCPGLDGCKNDFPGHRLIAEPDENLIDRINFKLQPCQLMEAYKKQRILQKRIKSHNVPDHIRNATFETLEFDNQRRAAIVECIKFCTEFQLGKTTIGLYLHGPFGVGKSRIAGAIANELAKLGIDVAIVYVPDFLEEIKDAIDTNTVGEKVEALKKVSVLILDDIGAETLSTWTRDSVIGPILNDRMEKLVTIYTSNLTTSELHRHFAKAKDEREPNEKKASRIMERIEPFVKVVSVNGRNRRR